MKFETYLKEHKWSEDEEKMLCERYQKEVKFLKEVVNNDSQLEGSLLMAMVMGQLAEKKDLFIRIQLKEGLFIMYLLGLTSCNCLEDKLYWNQPLEWSWLAGIYDYCVDDQFYELAAGDLQKHISGSGNCFMWIGEEKYADRYGYEKRKPCGIAIADSLEVLQYKDVRFTTLYDMTNCIPEESMPELSDSVCWYRFHTLSEITTDIWKKTGCFLNKYEDEIKAKNREQIMHKIAAAETIGPDKEYNGFYEVMGMQEEAISTRDELYHCLNNKLEDAEEAEFWTYLISNGELGYMIEENKMEYEDYAKLREALSPEVIGIFMTIERLPSRFEVMEKFYCLLRASREEKIIAVDFDGTLSLGKWPDMGPANTELITFLKKRRQMGDKLILWSCREGEALQQAVDWCKEYDLNFDAINDNLPEVIEWYGTNSRKISCNYYIDDRAVITNAFHLLEELHG